jgi:hypothetical protein
MQDPDPQQIRSQNSGAVEAQNVAKEGHRRSPRSSGGSVD